MYGLHVFEFDSAFLNSPVAVTDELHGLYRQLRRGHRVVARICGSRSSLAAGWLGYALEQAGVPFSQVAEHTRDAATIPGSLQLVVTSAPSQATAIEPSASAPPLRIVLLGLGTVGLGVY